MCTGTSTTIGVYVHAIVPSGEEPKTHPATAHFPSTHTNYINSLKTDEIRTVRGFSLDAQEKLSGEKWYDIYEAFWGEPDYADIFTASACNGTGEWADASVEMRAEGCIKGAQ